MSSGERREIVVVGAGLAGLSAASTLAAEGAEVTLLERRAFVGGRAYSYPHPALEEVVDSQHVLLGCCTNLLAFCESAGVADKIRWYDHQTFLEAGHAGRGPRASTIALSRLPAPLHYAGSFARAAMLSAADKLAIARGLGEFRSGYPAEDTESVAAWYARTRQTGGAIRHFWEPIVLATLNDSAENCSTRYAGKVFYELFLKTRTGGRLGIPTVPLSTFFAAGAELVEARGGRVELRTSVERIEREPGGTGWLLQMADRTIRAQSVVLALPFDGTERLLRGAVGLGPAEDGVRAELLADMSHFIHSPFLSVLLWYDREITDLDHAWLLDTRIQWFFHKSRIRREPPGQGSYVELVIAGARDLLSTPRAEILGPAQAELAGFFPAVREARLIKSAILKEARATFSVTPGLDRSRPAQAIAGLPGLFLAGDWTRTDWPSTMEGAVRSGRLAADALRGRGEPTLAPELMATGLMRWLERHPSAPLQP